MTDHGRIADLYYEKGLRILQIADLLQVPALEVSDSLEFNGTERSTLVSVGQPSDRLFKQGVCKGCRIPLFGGEPIRRDWCGACRTGRDAGVEVTA